MRIMLTATHTATMSLSSVQTFFQSLQLDIPILETEANTATVGLATACLFGCVFESL